MKKALIVALVVSIAALVESSAARADDAIKKVFADLDACLKKNDAKCVGGLMVDEATYAAPTLGDTILKGRAQIVKTLGDNMGAPDPNMKGAKVTHAIRNVRMLGEDRAFVDATVSVAGAKGGEEPGADGPGASYHAVVLLTRQGGTWLFEDLRSYSIEDSKERAKREAAAAQPPPGAQPGGQPAPAAQPGGQPAPAAQPSPAS